MDHSARRGRLAERLGALEVDGFLVTRLVNVRYLSGFTGSNAQFLLTPERGVLLTDSRYDEQSRREVPDLGRQIYGSGFVPSLEEASRSAGVRRVAFESAGVTYRSWKELSGIEGLELVPVDGEIERLRWAKEDEELRLLERAQEATDEAFDRVTRKLSEGMTEREVAFAIEQEMRAAGADSTGFDTIVAFGENAAEPHHHPTDRPLGTGDVVKLDFGCVVDGYHSDMTRTVALGRPDPAIVEIHELVLAAHEAGAAAVRAGVSGGEADAAAREIIAAAGHAEHFGHSLGHGVGLEIHEGPTLRRDSDDVLPAGAVVTVEPGIYLPGTGGVRIEDAVVVQEGGCRPLPRSPKELLVL